MESVRNRPRFRPVMSSLFVPQVLIEECEHCFPHATTVIVETLDHFYARRRRTIELTVDGGQLLMRLLNPRVRKIGII